MLPRLLMQRLYMQDLQELPIRAQALMSRMGDMAALASSKEDNFLSGMSIDMPDEG